MSTPDPRFTWIVPIVARRSHWCSSLLLLLVVMTHLVVTPVSSLAAPLADTPICYNLVPNGSFEQDSLYWRLTDSPRPAAPSNAVVLEGAKSMRVGNDEGLPNLANESEIRSQPVTLPANASTIILRFQYYPIHNAVPAESLDQDLQQAMIYQVYDANDPKKDQLIEPIFNVQENDRTWKLRELPISNYRGKAISIVLRVKNDGAQGLTLMYVDKVEIIYCTLTPIPTATATFTPTATTTPLPTATPLPAATTPPAATATTTPTPLPTATSLPLSPCMTAVPANSVCYNNLLVNGGFEYQGDWACGVDPVQARYVTEQRHSGIQSMLLGNLPGGPNVTSYSSIRQLVSIPANATVAHLCFRGLYRSEDTLIAQPGSNHDRQEVIALEPDLDVIEVLYRQNRNENGWLQQGISLNNYIGRTFNLYFNVYNNASPQHTWMYLDDVELFYCTTAPPPATPTYTPAPVVVLTPATPVPPTAIPPTVPPPTATVTTVPTDTVGSLAAPSPVIVTEAPLAVAPVVVQPIVTPIGAVVAVVTPAGSDLGATVNNQRVAIAATPVLPSAPLAQVNGWSGLLTAGIMIGVLALIGLIAYLAREIWRMFRGQRDPYA